MPARRGHFIPLCGEYVDRYLAEYEELHKDSSLIAACTGLKRFREDFADRSLDISRTELKDWMNGEGIWAHRPPVPRGYRPAIEHLNVLRGPTPFLIPNPQEESVRWRLALLPKQVPIALGPNRV